MTVGQCPRKVTLSLGQVQCRELVEPLLTGTVVIWDDGLNLFSLYLLSLYSYHSC